MKTNHFVQLWTEGRKHSGYGAPLVGKGRTTLYGFVDYTQAREKAINMGRNILKQNIQYPSRYTEESEGRIVLEFAYRPNERAQKVYTIIYA